MITRPQAYFSHPIRGGGYIPQEQNLKAAIFEANRLRMIYPTLDIYVPAEGEPFVGRAYKSEWLTEEQILDIDCRILEQDCSLLIIYPYMGQIGRGSFIELARAFEDTIPVYHHLDKKGIADWITSWYIGKGIR